MENASVSRGGIKKIYSPITVTQVGPGLNNTKWQAELRQFITTVYPGTRGNDSLSDALFSGEELGAKLSEFTSERVTWIPVPLNTTKEAVQEKLLKLPEARIARIHSLKPILTDEQINAMRSGISTMTIEQYEEKFVRERAAEGQLQGPAVLYNGRKQYGVNKFHASAKEDIDLRPVDLDNILNEESLISMTDRAIEMERGEYTPSRV